MYLNFFKRQWCTDDFMMIFKLASCNYDVYALTLQHDKIYYPSFHERYITHVIIENGNDRISYEVNSKLTDKDAEYFTILFNKFEDAHPVTKKDVPLHQNMKSDIETILGIDNNVNQEKDKKITFCLNDYTSIEREKIIAFLANIDGNSPEVYIDIDLSSCNKEQAEHLSNILLCASSLTNT